MNEEELTQRPRRRRGGEAQQWALPGTDQPTNDDGAVEEPAETAADAEWTPGSSIVAPYEPGDGAAAAESADGDLPLDVEPAAAEPGGNQPGPIAEAVSDASADDRSIEAAEEAVVETDLDAPAAEASSIIEGPLRDYDESPGEPGDSEADAIGEPLTDAEPALAGDGTPQVEESPAAPEEPQPRRRERRPGDIVEAVAAQQQAMPPAPLEVPAATPVPPRKGRGRGRRPEQRRGTPRQVDFASVQVDREDDLSTVFGKLHTATSPRVALVAHGGNRELEQSKLSLRRLKRYGEQTGKDVVLVSRRWNLRAKARREGVRTAYMTRGIRWGRRRRVGVSIPGLGSVTRLVVGLGVIFAVLLGAYLVVPSATIKIRPTITPISKPVQATVSLDVEEPDFETGELPAERLKVSVPFKIAVPVTGEGEVPTGTATGVVVFTNPKDEIVTIPEGTRVKTADAVVFLTDEEIDVPAGGEQDVEVTALIEGPSGAVPADSLTILEGDLLGAVTVTNPQPTDPEGTTTQPIVSEDDLANLRTVAVEQVSDTAMEQLRTENPGALVFGDTLVVQIVKEEFSAALGEQANWVTIDADLSVTAIAASAQDLRDMAKFWLAEDLNEDEVLLDSTLTAELAPDAAVDYDDEAGIVGAEILLQGGIIPYFDPAELKDDIAGTNVDDARLYLEDSFPSLTEPTVERGPGWLPGGLPRFDWRIQLIVEPGP